MVSEGSRPRQLPPLPGQVHGIVGPSAADVQNPLAVSGVHRVECRLAQAIEEELQIREHDLGHDVLVVPIQVEVALGGVSADVFSHVPT